MSTARTSPTPRLIRQDASSLRFDDRRIEGAGHGNGARRGCLCLARVFRRAGDLEVKRAVAADGAGDCGNRAAAVYFAAGDSDRTFGHFAMATPAIEAAQEGGRQLGQRAARSSSIAMYLWQNC